MHRQADLRRRANDAPLSEFESRFGEALEAGDPAGAEAVAAEAIGCGLEVEEIYSHVIAPAMGQIGHLWEEGAVSVGGEHLATAISQGVMARLFPVCSAATSVRGTESYWPRLRANTTSSA